MHEIIGRCVLGLSLLGATGCASTGTTYSNPREAMEAVAAVAGRGDAKALDGIFGADATDVLWSGDPVADRDDGALVKELIEQHVEFTPAADNLTVAVVGDARWPFPIPLEHVKNGYRFDLAAGREELLNRRVGRNELFTLATLHAYVDAQMEYASQGRDGKPPAFARKVRSSEGMHDGLYWPTAEGEPESPLGPLVAEATASGYHAPTGEPQPYHGYYYRILTGQGPDAPGGARSYIDSAGDMTGGFAAVAWPATHGNSGIMTFLVNEVGIVYQKDLGPSTDELARKITVFDPDDTWMPTAD